jgi:hypothetical protein
LDDGLGSLVAVIGWTSLTWGDWGVVNEFQKVLAIAGDDGELLAVFAQSIKLVGVGCLQLLAGNVGELGLSYKGLGFGADKLLLENDNLRGIGLLVLELSDLVGDLLLAYSRD